MGRLDSFQEPILGAHTDAVVFYALAALRHLARHAVTRTGASGAATVRAGLWSRPTSHPSRHRSSAVLQEDPAPLHLVHDPGVPISPYVRRLSTQAHDSATGEAQVLLEDLADGGTGLVQAASLVLGDLFQNYGLAEPEQITREGHVDLGAWSPDMHPGLRHWSAQSRVELLPAAAD
ncbi:hypothetical protein ACLIYP_22165 [Streptomyces nanhaiensis]|uniref:hypothetical protein n=1 Tax=Streptomyces nanhaiensis TaxID=679319 RepID=UPI00399CEF22